MENRFGIKDFFLFTLVLVLIIMVGLAMWQFDRQWEAVQNIQRQTSGLTSDVNDVKRRLREGVAVSGPAGGGLPAGPAGVAAADGPGRDGQSDPFYLIDEAEQRDDHAEGDWLIDNFGTQIARLTPFISSDIYATWVINMTTESLAYRDPFTLEYMPLLSRGWELSDDGLEMTFALRDDLNFSDGEPLDADDVLFTFDLIRNPEIQADRARAYLDKLASVDKVDERTVRFTFNEPYYLNFDTIVTTPILPEHFLKDVPPATYNEHVGLLLGSGPYRIAEGPDGWSPGSGVTLVRNNRYWGNAPAFERVIFREVEGETQQEVSFRNGETDVIRLPPELYGRLTSDEDLMAGAQDVAHFSPYKGYLFIAWNQVKPDAAGKQQPTPFADRRVRRAMSLLIDREQINRQVFEGQYVLAAGPFSPSSPQHAPDVEPLAGDVAEAKRLLEDAGYADRDGDGILDSPDGQPLEFRLTYPSSSTSWEKVVKIAADNLARGGVRMIPERTEWSSLVNKLDTREFDAITLGWSSSIESDPNQIFHSDSIAGQGDNFISYRNEALDAAIDAAREELDTEKRMALWHEVHRILAEDQPYTFLFFRPNLWLMSDRFENVSESKVGLNYEYLNGGVMPWFTPASQQKYTN